MITEFFQEQSKPSKKALERYQNLSKEKKTKKQKYGPDCHKSLSEEEKSKMRESACEQYKNLLDVEKQRLLEHVKNILNYKNKVWLILLLAVPNHCMKCVIFCF